MKTERAVLNGSIYDYPEYYDLVYGSDWRAEVDFLEQCFENISARPVRRLFEPACGTGRLLFRFAERGYETCGLDLNRRAVDFCNRRLNRHGFEPTAFVANMCDFKLDQPVDAAFNTINSFRHLASDEQAFAHLMCMADAIQPGGLYALGLHLTPDGTPDSTNESWSASSGDLSISTRMWLLDEKAQDRVETYRLRFDIERGAESFRIDDDLEFFTYSFKQIERLIQATGQFEIAACYDFAYDFEEPFEMDGDTEDVVIVMRKFGGDRI